MLLFSKLPNPTVGCGLKHKTALIVLLALSAGVLSAVVSMTPTVQAQSGSVHGMVYWIDMYGDAHPMAWAQVTASDGVNSPVIAYTTDGSYTMWLPEGTYDITASSEPGFFPETITGFVVSPGSATGLDFILKPTGKPIPELPPWAQPLILLCAMMITVLAVRRYRVRPRA